MVVLLVILEILSNEGHVLVSVPIECGLPSLPKIIFRRSRYGREQRGVYNVQNMMRSLFELPIPEHRTGKDYLSHMGFYFKDLEILFEKFFHIEARKYSPFPAIGPQLNSQVFYKLSPLL